MATTPNGKTIINTSVREETASRIEEIAQATFRGKNDVIDLAITRLYTAYKNGELEPPSPTTPAEQQ